MMRIESPVRASRTYTQHLVAPPETVFPLLCPVMECEWAMGWMPNLVVTESGIAEKNCVFTTGADPESIWVITEYDPAASFVEMLKITPGVTACRLTIRLAPHADGSTAEITYCHTSLSPLGDEFVPSFTEEFYTEFMREWEDEMNRYLRTGVPVPKPAD